jgi:hypothetical protein
MDDTNWTDASEIIRIVEDIIDFGPGGASIIQLKHIANWETVIQNPFEFLPFLPNAIYVSNESIRINYEIDTLIGEQLCDNPGSINWSKNHEDLLGFDIPELVASITHRISGEVSIHGEYLRINGPDDESCFNIRDYYVLVIEMRTGKVFKLV